MPVGNLEEFPNDINDNSFFLQINFFPSKKNQFRFMSKYEWKQNFISNSKFVKKSKSRLKKDLPLLHSHSECNM